MTRFNYINDNIEKIKIEAKAGIVSLSVLNHYAIYCRYDYYRKTGINITLSALFAGDDFKLDERTVHRIIKSMKEEI